VYNGEKHEKRSGYKKKSQSDETSVMSVKLVYLFVIITGLFRSLVQFCLNSSFRCVYCHKSSVQVLVQWCLNRSFVYLLSSEVCSCPYALLSEQTIHHTSLSSKVPSGPCESSSEQIFIYLMSSQVCSGPCAVTSEDIYVFAVIRGLFRPLYIIS
jgi:hypothetical protein